VVKSWLGQKTQVQEVVGSNPAIYWMNVSNASYYIFNEKGNKGSQVGHTTKNIFKKELKVLRLLRCRFLIYRDQESLLSECQDKLRPRGLDIPLSQLQLKQRDKHKVRRT
jgi:hypothetical protein